MGARTGERVVADFFHMGGYAFYVWSAYALVMTVLVGNVVLARSQHKRVLARLGPTGSAPGNEARPSGRTATRPGDCSGDEPPGGGAT